MSLQPSHLRIAGGRVVDPSQDRDEPADVYVVDGRIVETPPERIDRTIDASGMLVVAGAIDMHAHFASRGIDLARRIELPHPELVPTPERLGAAYLKQGYTTAIDAAIPAADVPWARRTMEQIPWLDTGYLLELGHDRELVQTIYRQGATAAIGWIGRLLDEHRAFGIKLVNPGHAEQLDAGLYGTCVTPLRLIQVCSAAAEKLGLTHPLHLHAPGLGEPDSCQRLGEMLEQVSEHRVHLAHVQFYAYQPSQSGRRMGDAGRLADYLADYPNLTADTGNVGFGHALMVTRDRPLAMRIQACTGAQPTLEHGWAVAPLRYDATNPVSAMQWAVGLELILRSEALDRLTLSIDHPNGGALEHLTGLLKPLMNARARHRQLAEIHPAAGQRTGLSELDRQLTDAEAVMLTRLAPARALGLSDRGHLAPGAVADLVITPELAGPAHTVLKSGRVVVRDRQVRADPFPGSRLSGRVEDRAGASAP